MAAIDSNNIPKPDNRFDTWLLLTELNDVYIYICVINCHGISGVAAIPVLREFLKMFPNPTSVLTGDTQPTIAELMKPLGLYHKRADIIYKFSSE